MSNEDFEWSTQVGGSGGGAFDDYDDNPGKLGKIKKITINSGHWVNSISVEYGDASSTSDSITTVHGTPGGGPNTKHFTLEDDEYITKVNGSYGDFINSLSFTTSKGRTSPTYGQGGSAFPEIESDDRYLIAIGGRSGNYLDAAKFYFAKQPIQSVEITDVNISVSEEPTTTYPLTTDPIVLVNHGDEKQRLVHVFSRTETTEFMISTSVNVTAGLKLTIGWFILEKFEAEISVSVGVTHTDSEASTQSTTYQERMHIDVPAKKMVRGTITAQRKRFKTTWTGTAIVTYASGLTESIPVTNGTVSGFHEGYDMKAIWDEPTDIDSGN